jgi:hypothetical protein
MTTRKAGQLQKKKQIPFGNDRKKGNSKGNSNSNSKDQNAGISPLRVRKNANAPVEMTRLGWRESGRDDKVGATGIWSR